MLFDFTHKTPVDFIDEIGWCFTGIFLSFSEKIIKKLLCLCCEAQKYCVVF